ncbi:putative homeobox protein [Rosellinia necatrix]|uniref:Putative homeobox protein n=1 Tax=Rosellinia necatrix TaxID=77044 RepID=A0A1S7UIE5_ROSNE|nr:putative homeobox protein [Rosellinia necatrix]
MNMQFCPPQGFGSPYGFPQGQGAAMTYSEPQYSMHAVYHNVPYMYGYQPHRPPMMTDRGGLCDGKTESKPRLSKDEVEKLEKVFQENPKPSSSVKAQLADSLGLERPRINNWFQNRRAKAKQERKQEEYEARRAAEKSASEPSSPDEDSYPGSLDSIGEVSHKRTQPSSAAFPHVSSPSRITDSSHDDEDEEEGDDEEEEEENDEENEDDNVRVAHHSLGDADSVCMQSSASTQAELTDTYHSPLPMEFSQSDPAAFTHHHNTGGYPQRSGSDFGLFPSLGHDQGMILDGLPRRVERSMSSDGHFSQHYSGMRSAALPSSNSRSMFCSPVSNGDTCDMSENPFDTTGSPDCHNDQTSHVSPGMPTPTDSFRSPPPPANIASRRNIPRPASLQAASLKSRSYNLPKTAMDASKRMENHPSPVASIRRISSVTGLGAGRIQKNSINPRSPFLARAVVQYHARSPVGSGTPTFPGAAPPTPMTPALFDQHHGQEPAVMSASPDNSSFVLGMGVSSNFVQEIKEEHELKTPPTTPGIMNEFNTNGYVGNTFNSGFNITTDQPLLTPYFHSEFPDLSVQNVPGYVESSDDGPSTPVFAGVINSGLEHTQFNGNIMANTQYDWDANESVVSSRSSPGYSRSKHIQFTPNMTPQDYHH